MGMISLTLCLYIGSALTIGILAGFAANNRKSGWTKTRTSLAQALDDLYLDLGFGSSLDAPVNNPVARKVDSAEFSQQLIHLRNALGESTKVTPASPTAAEQHEMVLVPVSRAR